MNLFFACFSSGAGFFTRLPALLSSFAAKRFGKSDLPHFLSFIAYVIAGMLRASFLGITMGFGATGNFGHTGRDQKAIYDLPDEYFRSSTP